MSQDSSEPLLTLEPLIDAVRHAVEGCEWTLSGLQKTTSHEFQGRWEGESTRSAYLFFHQPDRWEAVSIDVYLDETSRGLQGNLALVLEGRPLGELGRVEQALRVLGAASVESSRHGDRMSISLRARLSGPEADPADSDVEVRVKSKIPPAAIQRGAEAVSVFAVEVVRELERLAVDERVLALVRLR